MIIIIIIIIILIIIIIINITTIVILIKHMNSDKQTYIQYRSRLHSPVSPVC